MLGRSVRLGLSEKIERRLPVEAVIGQEGMLKINYRIRSAIDPRQARTTSSLQGRRVCGHWQREHLLQNRDEHRRFTLSQFATTADNHRRVMELFS